MKRDRVECMGERAGWSAGTAQFGKANFGFVRLALSYVQQWRRTSDDGSVVTARLGAYATSSNELDQIRLRHMLDDAREALIFIRPEERRGYSCLRISSSS